MTKATRWGVSALMILGGVALGGFAGCSDDDPQPGPVVDTDTGVLDTGTTDTGTTDTGTPDTTPTDTGTDGDTAAPAADRAVSLVFASPDLGEKLLCLGAFAGTADPAATDTPLQALGPIGRPDATAPDDPAKFTGLPYGAVVPVPLSSAAIAALEALQVVIYLVDSNPLPGSTCAAEWKNVKADTTKWQKFPAKTIAKGDSAAVIFRGCKTPTGNPSCGSATASNFEIALEKLDTTIPTTFAGGGTGAKVGFQLLHESLYAGGTGLPPTLQGQDVYLVPMVPAGGGDAGADGGDADDAGDASPTMVPGTPVKLADNVSYKSKAPGAIGVQLQGDPKNALLVFTPTGAGAPTCFFSATSPTCANTAVPLASFLTAYAPTGGGFVDGTNQFIAVSGALIPPPPATPTIRAMFGKSAPIE